MNNIIRGGWQGHPYFWYNSFVVEIHREPDHESILQGVKMKGLEAVRPCALKLCLLMQYKEENK